MTDTQKVEMKAADEAVPADDSKKICPECKKPTAECACKTEKGAATGEDPAQANADATTQGHTTTTQPVIGGTQDVFAPSSSVNVGRDAVAHASVSGLSPSDAQYGHKGISEDKLDFQKSPLYNEMKKTSDLLSKQLDGMMKSLNDRVTSFEKSTNDRMSNLQKGLDKFFSQPFQKAHNENVGAESVKAEKSGLKKSVDAGNARFAE